MITRAVEPARHVRRLALAFVIAASIALAVAAYTTREREADVRQIGLASIGDSDAYREAKAMVGLTTIGLAVITQDTTYEFNVTLPSGEHHDIVVCPGGNPFPVTETRTCTTYDEARAP